MLNKHAFDDLENEMITESLRFGFLQGYSARHSELVFEKLLRIRPGGK